MQLLNSHPGSEHEPGDGQTVHTAQDGVQVPLIGGLVVHDVDLQGVGRAIIRMLGPLGVIIIIIVIIILSSPPPPRLPAPEALPLSATLLPLSLNLTVQHFSVLGNIL